jgi:hypothetical protein
MLLLALHGRWPSAVELINANVRKMSCFRTLAAGHPRLSENAFAGGKVYAAPLAEPGVKRSFASGSDWSILRGI